MIASLVVCSKSCRAGRPASGKTACSRPSNIQPKNAAASTSHFSRVETVLVKDVEFSATETGIANCSSAMSVQGQWKTTLALENSKRRVVRRVPFDHALHFFELQ